MTRLLLLALFGLHVAPVSTASAAPQPQTPDTHPTIVELARAAGSFETLLAAAEAAGLLDALKGDEPLTVLAPTDDAFAKLGSETIDSLLLVENRGRLKQILTAHVVAGRQSASSLVNAGQVSTVGGVSWNARLEGGQLRVGAARVTANDLAASNGVVHVIDAVLVPEEESMPGSDPERAALGVLTLAIERGVPLFNAGHPDACAAVYEVASRSLVERPGSLSESVLTPLREALSRTVALRDPRERAWALRAGLDGAISTLADSPGDAHAATPAPSGGDALFDFTTEAEVRSWFTVNDDVMGGISRARLVPAGPGVARFEGTLSLDNNGGFATIRSRARDLDLDGANALRLRIKGDGRTYWFSALTTDRRSEIRTWQKKFATEAGVWQEITIPIDDLVLTVMGRRLPTAPRLAPNDIRSLAFGIADKDESPFALEIDRIEVIRDRTSL